jgi:hypothetical protein
MTLVSEPVEQHRLQIAATIEYCHDQDPLIFNPVNDAPGCADQFSVLRDAGM